VIICQPPGHVVTIGSYQVTVANVEEDGVTLELARV
jgi:hypothetical protein